MRDEFKQGDQVLIYHSRLEDPVIPGIAEVAREAYPDPSALDPKSDYYDERAKGLSPWVMVDVRATQRFTSPVTRSALKAEKRLSNMMVLKKGARLSVQPVTKEEFEIIRTLGAPQALVSFL